MKVLYVLLALSMLAIVVAVGAMVWRLRWHMKRPHLIPPTSAIKIPPEQEPVEKA